MRELGIFENPEQPRYFVETDDGIEQCPAFDGHNADYSVWLRRYRGATHRVVVSNPYHLVLATGTEAAGAMNRDTVARASFGAKAVNLVGGRQDSEWLRPARVAELVGRPDEEVITIDGINDETELEDIRTRIFGSQAPRVLLELRGFIVSVLDRSATTEALLRNDLPKDRVAWKRINRTSKLPRNLELFSWIRKPSLLAIFGKNGGKEE